LHIFAAVGDVFKALADPTRRAILDELAERDGQTLFEICARLLLTVIEDAEVAVMVGADGFDVRKTLSA